MRRIDAWLPDELAEWFELQCQAEGRVPGAVLADIIRSMREQIAAREFIEKYGMTMRKVT